jgi:hypothetical protein
MQNLLIIFILRLSKLKMKKTEEVKRDGSCSFCPGGP